MPLHGWVHYGRDYDNAFWDNAGHMFFGDGDGQLFQRFTIALGSRSEIHEAHREFTVNREDWRLRCLEELCESRDGATFQFADLNGNWWEITNAQS